MQELGSKPALEAHLSELDALGLYLTRLLVGCRFPNFQIGLAEGRRVSPNPITTVPTNV